MLIVIITSDTIVEGGSEGGEFHRIDDDDIMVATFVLRR